MKENSAVAFATLSRIHVGLPVTDLQRSLRFYESLFGQLPTKTRSGYAKFEVTEPPVNLSLNAVVGNTAPRHPVSHFGIQVKSSEAVTAMATQLAEAGHAVDVEQQVTCCYAVQNKVWASDPDGNKWEVYVVLDDHGTQHDSSAKPCCGEPAGMASAEPEFAESAVASAEGRSVYCCT